MWPHTREVLSPRLPKSLTSLIIDRVKENCETAFRGYHKDGKDHDHHNDHNEQSGPSGQGGQTGQTGSTGSTGSTSHTSKRDAALTPCAVDCTKSFSQCGFSTEEYETSLPGFTTSANDRQTQGHV